MTANHVETLQQLAACCLSWEPQVCVMGNVRAGDAAAALQSALSALQGQGWMAELGERIRTQDNRITRDPIFVVEEKDGRKWKFVTACFTDAGAKAYLRVNGHNLREPRTYVYSGFRNAEWIKLRDHFASLPHPPTASDQE